MDDLKFRVEIEKLLVNNKYWNNYSWMNNTTGNEIIIEKLSNKISLLSFKWNSQLPNIWTKTRR